MRATITNTTTQKLILDINATRIAYKDKEFSIRMDNGFHQELMNLERDAIVTIDATLEDGSSYSLLCSFISYSYVLFAENDGTLSVADNTALFKVLR